MNGLCFMIYRCFLDSFMTHSFVRFDFNNSRGKIWITDVERESKKGAQRKVEWTIDIFIWILEVRLFMCVIVLWIFLSHSSFWPSISILWIIFIDSFDVRVCQEKKNTFKT